MDAARLRPGPDSAVVRAARGGHADALDNLVAHSLPLVYNIVGRALRGHADVDDVVQETLLRMVAHLPELRDPAAYRSWLVAIAIRQVRDRENRRRTALVRSVALDDAHDLPDSAVDFAELTIARLGLTDQRREVAEATRWLHDEDRSLLALWWLEETGELGRADLAHALQLSAPHAAVRVARMKDQVNAARAVVRALRAEPGCGDLERLTRDWDGVPDPLWRKRLARHVRDCATCGDRSGGMLPMERLLAGAPLVAVPLHLVAQVAAATAAGAGPLLAKSTNHTATGTGHGGTTSGGTTHGVAGHTGHAARRGIRALLPTGAHAVAAIGAAAVVATTLVAIHLSGREAAAPVASTAVAPPPASVSARPSASPARAVQPPTPPGASPSPSPRPTASPGPSHPAPPAAPAVTSSKKGVSVWTFNGVDKALTESGASWYYTWSTGHGGVRTPPGVDFVPMMWGPGSLTTGALSQAKAAGHTLLGFNEPDLGAQSNMTVDAALSLWPKLMATGMTLGSPAVASGGGDPGGWLDQFMSGAKSRGYRVDFIALHWYGGDFTTGDAVNQLHSYLQAVYNRYNLPIWLTEYALIDFSHGTRYPSEAQQAAFVTASTKMLGGLSYLKRYAWFALPAADSGPSTGLFRSGPAVTDVGRAFEAAG